MLRRRRMHLEDYNCVLCQHPPEETLMHLLFFCPFAKDCWSTWNFQFAEQLSIPQNFHEWKLLQNVSFALDFFILICWAIWSMRNDVIFQNKHPSVDDCRRVVIVESLLLLHRTKNSVTTLLESWINSNL
jgi:hypothetical protein